MSSERLFENAAKVLLLGGTGALVSLLAAASVSAWKQTNNNLTVATPVAIVKSYNAPRLTNAELVRRGLEAKKSYSVVRAEQIYDDFMRSLSTMTLLKKQPPCWSWRSSKKYPAEGIDLTDVKCALNKLLPEADIALMNTALDSAGKEQFSVMIILPEIARIDERSLIVAPPLPEIARIDERSSTVTPPLPACDNNPKETPKMA